MFAIEIHSEVRPDKRDEFLQAISTLRPPGDADGGCVAQGVYEARAEPNRFLWVEQWPDQTQLQQRLRSPKFRALLGAVRVLGVVSTVQTVEVTPWIEQTPDNL